MLCMLLACGQAGVAGDQQVVGVLCVLAQKQLSGSNLSLILRKIEMELSAGQCPAQNCTQLQLVSSGDGVDVFVFRDGYSADQRVAVESIEYKVCDMGVSAAHKLCHSSPGVNLTFK